MQRWSASSLPSSPEGYCQLHAVSISYSHLCRASLVLVPDPEPQHARARNLLLHRELRRRGPGALDHVGEVLRVELGRPGILAAAERGVVLRVRRILEPQLIGTDRTAARECRVAAELCI